jgi:hypothetical protein
MAFMTLNEIAPHIPDMIRLRVSEVARSPRGFLTAYKQAGSYRKLSDSWKKKRSAFIARTLPQYRKNKTLRRWLSLVAWAYYPGVRPN